MRRISSVILNPSVILIRRLAEKNLIITKLPIFLILTFALLIRLYGLNWDQGQHLHPDERFLTMVAVAQRFPHSLKEYLDPVASKLNPANVGYPFYVYGTFPVAFVKYVATALSRGDYFLLTQVGRVVSAFLDVGIVLFVYLLTSLFAKQYKWDQRIKYASAFLYSIMVFPIQQAHFFTVDNFVTFFMLGALYFAYRARLLLAKRELSIILSAAFFGLALACKVNAVYIAPLIAAVLFIKSIKKFTVRQIPAILISGLFFIAIAYTFLRLADPYLFANGNFFDPQISPLFIKNILELKVLSSPDVWYPPGVQWLTKTKIIFPLQNIFFFGMGPILFISAIMGVWMLLKNNRRFELFLLYLWALAFFIYQGMQFGMTMRYFSILYPLLAISAGYFVVNFFTFNSEKHSTDNPLRLNKRVWRKPILGIYVILILIWPLAFLSIYSRPHSRVTASKWMYANLPPTAVLAQEHWDDSLPLGFPENINSFTTIQMPVFAADDTVKWNEITDALKKADYIVFTSNRGYGSITTAPQRFPKMTQFYTDLFAGKLEFKKIQEFTSYPSLTLGAYTLEIPDQWSEEAFTVYDHPKVTIFQKQ